MNGSLIFAEQLECVALCNGCNLASVERVEYADSHCVGALCHWHILNAIQQRDVTAGSIHQMIADILQFGVTE